ncbi:hypothetical protein Ciccas_007963 [Cichlidogyrus casuarinus]|uniref:MHC class I antigen n=1 Tax=Cichlidogyrus casuarinus TaxID=1844966 RepID=A0ABD2Q2R3_9PLAT
MYLRGHTCLDSWETFMQFVGTGVSFLHQESTFRRTELHEIWASQHWPDQLVWKPRQQRQQRSRYQNRRRDTASGAVGVLLRSPVPREDGAVHTDLLVHEPDVVRVPALIRHVTDQATGLRTRRDLTHKLSMTTIFPTWWMIFL